MSHISLRAALQRSPILLLHGNEGLCSVDPCKEAGCELGLQMDLQADLGM